MRKLSRRKPKTELDALTRAAQECKAVTWHADDPDLADSLRLLITEQGYTHADVAPMFGVSREQVRLWAKEMAVAKPHGKHVCRRYWDDAAHCFRPITRTAIAQQARATKRIARQAQKERRRAEDIAKIQAYATRLGRELALREMWYAISGHDDTPVRAISKMVSRWARKVRFSAGACAAIRAECGLSPARRGYAGRPENLPPYPHHRRHPE